MTVTTESEPLWTMRLRIGLMEPDAALRSVLTTTLLRAGCVVQFRRTLEQAEAALRDGELDAVIAAVDENLLSAVRLASIAPRGTRLIVLTTIPVDPYLMQLVPGVSFYQKPFDARALLRELGLGEPGAPERKG